MMENRLANGLVINEKDSGEMAFYDDISKYYDSIFPISSDTLEFIKGSIGDPPKEVLDIACGTGEYAIELEKCGYNLTAVDIDSKMIENLCLKINNKKNKVQFLQANMMDLHKKFNEDKFQVIYCIGNSLVHLENINQIKLFFMDIRKLLTNGGKFIFQIINYDRIIENNIRFLPTIINESINLRFERFYDYNKEINIIIFKTILSVENKKLKNEIPLIPLRHDEAISLLKDSGFNQINIYGDFKKSNFDKANSYSLIIEAI